MNKAGVFFKFSDLIMHYPRNYKKYPSVIVEKGISFDDRYGRFTKADIFYKNAEGKRPVLVNVHGGGFVKGDKRHRATFCAYFADMGWFVLNINYRLPPHTFPAGIEDTVSALNLLPGLFEKYNLDLDKIVITGDSAGAYYAAAGAVAATNEDFRIGLSLPELKVKIRAFAGFCGAYHLEKLLAAKFPLNMAESVAEALLGYKLDANPGSIKDFVYADYINLLPFVTKDFPESFILYSKYDAFCGGQGELLEEKLISEGVKHTTYIAKEKNDIHCYHLFPFHKGTKPCMDAAAAFLKNL